MYIEKDKWNKMPRKLRRRIRKAESKYPGKAYNKQIKQDKDLKQMYKEAKSYFSTALLTTNTAEFNKAKNMFMSKMKRYSSKQLRRIIENPMSTLDRGSAVSILKSRFKGQKKLLTIGIDKLKTSSGKVVKLDDTIKIRKYQIV